MQGVCNSVAFEGDYIKHKDLLHEKKITSKIYFLKVHRIKS
jgi:hypothetical protein